jgi:hypothetical protein
LDLSFAFSTHLVFAGYGLRYVKTMNGRMRAEACLFLGLPKKVAFEMRILQPVLIAAPKARNVIAQGNALGKVIQLKPSKR